jgi:hypothetical protein
MMNRTAVQAAIAVILDAVNANMPATLIDSRVVSHTNGEYNGEAYGVDVTMKNLLPYRVRIDVSHISHGDLFNLSFTVLPAYEFFVRGARETWISMAPLSVLSDPAVIELTLAEMNATARRTVKRYTTIRPLPSSASIQDFQRVLMIHNHGVEPTEDSVRAQLTRCGIVLQDATSKGASK